MALGTRAASLVALEISFFKMGLAQTWLVTRHSTILNHPANVYLATQPVEHVLGLASRNAQSVDCQDSSHTLDAFYVIKDKFLHNMKVAKKTPSV
jgi:hypothetical protein